MRYTAIALISMLLFSACSKDKYTTAPQISFTSITSTFDSNNPDPLQSPKLTIQVTDAEGDFGFGDGDTSYVFVKNLTVPPFKMDSFPFPESLTGVVRKNFKGDVDISLRGDGSGGSGVLSSSVGIPRPFTDTVFFEVYVRDFAKNKSNVIKTDDPLYYVSP